MQQSKFSKESYSNVQGREPMNIVYIHNTVAQYCELSNRSNQSNSTTGGGGGGVANMS